MTNSLSAALRSYTGRGVSSFPRRDPEEVQRAAGSTDADQLLVEIEKLLNEMGELQPDWNSHSLGSATTWAEGEMRARHPELDGDALATLAWSWSYDQK